jgi:hypothetical protein
MCPKSFSVEMVLCKIDPRPVMEFLCRCQFQISVVPNGVDGLQLTELNLNQNQVPYAVLLWSQSYYRELQR